MATTSKGKTTDKLLLFSNLSLIATEKDIVDFLGVMVECYFQKTKNGVLTGKCYVNIRDKKLAKEALKKNGENLLGCPVQITKTSETISSYLQAKRNLPSSAITRISPFGKNASVVDIKCYVRNCYKSVSSVDVKVVHRGKLSEHQIALVTFDNFQAAASAMELAKQENKPLSKNKLASSNDINDYLDKHRKEMFWA